MEQIERSDTVRTITEDNQTRQINQDEPIRSNQEGSFRSSNKSGPVQSTSQVNTVRTSKTDSRNRMTSLTRVVYWLLSMLEGLLAFRLILKLFGARTSSTFVTIIYDATNFFTAPFTGIFKPVESGFETSTLIAMIVYAVAGWGLAKLIAIITNSSSVTRQVI